MTTPEARPRAVLMYPAGQPEWLPRLTARARARQREVVAVVPRMTPAGWSDAMAYVLSGEADMVVVPRRDMLPSDRTPRLETLDE